MSFGGQDIGRGDLQDSEELFKTRRGTLKTGSRLPHLTSEMCRDHFQNIIQRQTHDCQRNPLCRFHTKKST